MTNTCLVHGLGSRVAKIIGVMGLVSLLNKKGQNFEFIYTPLSLEHRCNFNHNELFSYYHKPIINKKKEYTELCMKWDEMFDYRGIKLQEVDENEVVFVQGSGDAYGETEKNILEESRLIKSKIKKIFNLEKKTRSDKKNVYVHIRRSDAIHFDFRWLTDEYYLDVIKKIEAKLGKQNYEIIISTQRKNFNESNFKNYKIEYDDEIPDYISWTNLVNADVLVLGRSSFSYGAGILCDGIVIYPEQGMFHDKLNGWITINEL